MKLNLYLDHNATTPLHPVVAEKMQQECLQSSVPANPSSLHRHGRAARKILDDARDQLSSLLAVESSELHFTSGGTESNNLAIKGLAPIDAPLFVGATEHPSVLEPARQQWQQGRPGGVLEVDSSGKIRDFEVVDGALYSIQWINNETGISQDISKLAGHIHDGGGLLHIDGAQGFFRIPRTIPELDVDAATITAHKSFGPVGAGALWVRKGLLIDPLLRGGPQEKKIRPGTENLLSITGMGELARVACISPLWDLAALRLAREALLRPLQEIPNCKIIPQQEDDWPGCVHVSFRGVHAETLLVRLDMEGISASSGSACSSGAREPSHVLEAMGVDLDWIRGSIRLSLGSVERASQKEILQLTSAGKLIASIVSQLRHRDFQTPPGG